MDKAKALYELENGVILRDGDKVRITTDETEFDKEYISVVEITEDGLFLTNGEAQGGILFEYIVDVEKLV